MMFSNWVNTLHYLGVALADSQKVKINMNPTAARNNQSPGRQTHHHQYPLEPLPFTPGTSTLLQLVQIESESI